MNAQIRAALSVAAVIVHGLALAQVKPATNDPTAVYERGMFLMPSGIDAKESYSIILRQADGTEKAIAMPAGSTGIRVVDAVLPEGAWSWRYVVQRAALPKLAVIEPKSPQVSYSDLLRYNDAVFLSWKHLEPATKYRVTVQTDKASSPSLPPDWGSPANTDLSDENINREQGVGFYDLPVKSESRIQWSVTALDKDGVAIAKSEPALIVPGVPWSKELSDSGWKLQRSDTLSKDVASKAAIFGYESNQKGKDPRGRNYQAEFALLWTAKRSFTTLDLYPQASIEARLHSSGANKAKDAVKVRFGGYRMTQGVPGEFVANLKYETESKEDTKKGLLELAFTPTTLPFARYYPNPTATNAAGNYSPSSLPPLQWMVQLTVGTDLGKTFSVGSSSEIRKTNLRQKVSLRLDTRLNAVADALRLPKVDAYLASTYHHLSREEADEYTFSTVGLTFQLTKELSLELSYSVGADAPTFGFTRTGLVGFGLKF